MSSGKVVLGVIAGAAAGVALGILFAPDKGVNTRKKISQLGEDYLNNLKDKIQDILINAATEFDYIEREATNLVENVNDKVDETSKANIAFL